MTSAMNLMRLLLTIWRSVHSPAKPLHFIQLKIKRGRKFVRKEMIFLVNVNTRTNVKLFTCTKSFIAFQYTPAFMVSLIFSFNYF
jgi:hypothetical protein